MGKGNSMLQTNGYMAATRDTGMPRDIEYQVFCKITGAMNRASTEPVDFPALAAALNENLTLWQTISLDVIDDDNGLPEHLRAQLFYLYEFTQAQTIKILRGEAKTAALIEVNTSIIRGLRQNNDVRNAV